jgi:hypothetical protein
MIIPERVTRTGSVCPAFQIDERFAEEVGKRRWCLSSAGYLWASMSGRQVLLHRYIWRLHTGDWPKYQIDHINRNPLDNQVANLRDVSRSENQKNRTPFCLLGKKHPKKSGLPTGVRFVLRLKSRPYGAMVNYKGKKSHIGYFATSEEASAAYQQVLQLIRTGVL